MANLIPVLPSFLLGLVQHGAFPLAVRVQSELSYRLLKSVGKSSLYIASNTLFINIMQGR